MAGKRRLPTSAAGDLVRIGGRAPQPRQDLAAHALDRLGVEARRGQRQLEQVERLVLVLDQRAQRAGELVAAGAEAEADRVSFRCARGTRASIEIAGAFVEQVGHHVGEAGLAGRVLARTRRGRQSRSRSAAALVSRTSQASMPPGLTTRSTVGRGSRRQQPARAGRARRSEQRRAPADRGISAVTIFFSSGFGHSLTR